AAIAPATAQAWFATLRDGVAWKSERRLMYEREVDVPRLLASFKLEEVRAAHASARRAPVHDVLLAAAGHAEAISGVRFDSVGLNHYRDGRDSVAPHNDHLDELAPGAPIALLSLGFPRRMTIRAKHKPPRVLHLELEPGSVLTMSYETQLNYDHGIPKTTDPVGPRISLAFRVRPKQGGSRYR
ncbi:MAG TPA: alpha-ketoglutarate-dependent dioxygenase AlkB, partial [Candidatus Saccharimonadia bacterium]|nr:alpha-ketoglutarate-dependent dioxygenase AlkB [Candidatus Saccharimonadia bacterium]